MLMDKNTYNWWEKKRLAFNLYAIGSGILCLIFVWLLIFILKSKLQLFFIIPSALLYLVFLNILYLFGWLFYEFSPVTIKEDAKRKWYFKFLISITIGLNLLMMLWVIFDFLL